MRSPKTAILVSRTLGLLFSPNPRSCFSRLIPHSVIGLKVFFLSGSCADDNFVGFSESDFQHPREKGHGKQLDSRLSAKDFVFLLDDIKKDEKGTPRSDSADLESSKESALAISAVINSACHMFDEMTVRFLRQFRGKLDCPLVCEVLRLVRDPQSAVRFFMWAGQQIGYQHNNSTCELLLNVLQLGKTNRVPEIFLREIGEEDREILGRLLNVLVLNCCRRGRWNEALEELGRLKDFGYKPTRSVYNALIQVLLKADRLDSAFLVHLEMSRSGFFMDSLTMGSFAYALCKNGRWAEALNIIDKEDFTPDTNLYTKMISGLVEASLYSEAMGFLDRMRAASCHPNLLTFKTLLQGFLRKGQLGWCKRIIKTMMIEGFHPCPSLFNSLVHAYCSSGDYSYAYKLLKKMAACGCGPGYITYNVFIGSICGGGNLSSLEKLDVAEKVYKEMLDAGFVLNKVNAGNYVHSLCAVGKFKVAFSVMKEMMKRGFLPDASTYGRVIEILCGAYKVEEALLLFEEMKENGVSPDVYVYSILIDSFCKVGLIQQARDWFDEMARNGCAPNVVTYTSLLHGYLKLMRVVEADEIFQAMVSAGCRPNVVTYSALIDGLCKAGEIEKARQVLDKMRGNGGEEDEAQKVNPNVYTYGALVNGLCKVHKADEAHELVNTMLLSGCIPNQEVYDALIDGFCKIGKLDKAQEVFTEMSARGYFPNVYTYSCLIDRLFKDSRLDLALKVLTSMLEESCPPNVVTYTEMIDGLCKMGKVEEAHKLLILMEEKGCNPNVVTYTAMIDGFGKAGMIDRSLGLLTQMTAKGCAPNFITYRILINHCCTSGLLDQALGLLKEMKQTYWPVHFSLYKKVISGFSKEFLSLHGLMEDMQARGHVPTLPAYSLLVDRLIKAGRLDEALELYWELSSAASVYSRCRHEDLCSSLIEALCVALKVDEALQLYADVSRRGTVPELDMFLWIVRGLFMAGKWDEAIQMSHSLCNMVSSLSPPPPSSLKHSSSSSLLRLFFVDQLFLCLCS